MKTFVLSLVVITIFNSCKTAAWFDTPDDLGNINATLYLTNGEKLEGKLSVNDGWNGVTTIRLPGERKGRRYKFSEIEGYKVRNEYYERKEIRDGASLSRNYRYHFMKRLTPENSKIRLYEYLEQETSYGAHRRTRPVESVKKDYIQLPSEKEDGVWNIGLSKFVPNFDEKMSKEVSDCPSLAQKIANKEKDYFYPQFGGSEERRVDILWKIIEEYNSCR